MKSVSLVGFFMFFVIFPRRTHSLRSLDYSHVNTYTPMSRTFTKSVRLLQLLNSKMTSVKDYRDIATLLLTRVC